MKTKMINTRILLSGATILAAAAVIVGATFAFFSDTETSTGNTLAAGAIDLQIDNTSFVVDYLQSDVEDPVGDIVASPNNTWQLADLTNELFFSFLDVKPGDIGEDTISIHVNDNDAYVCMAGDVTDLPENELGGPEEDAGDTTEDEGELQNYLEFAFWYDDGDNVFENGEILIDSLSGTAEEVFTGAWHAIADSTTGDGPLPGGETFFVAKAWCFGDLEPVDNPDDSNDSPEARNETGFACDGDVEGVNVAQTDGILADISFYAVQSRNNDTFTCGDLPPFVGGEEPEEENVGALLSAYTAPETCDVTLDATDSIQTAVDAASAGQTICLNDGVYNNDTYPIRLNKDNLTLAGVNPPTSTAELPGGVVIDNDGVTLTGVYVSDETSLFGETWGVYINTGVDNAEISYNRIEGNDTNPSRGIVNATGTTTNALISHNEISDWFTGIFMNPSSGMVMEYNTLTSNAVGSANDGPTGNAIRYSVIKDNTIEGVGVSDSVTGPAGSLSVNFNNIYGNPSGEQMNNYDVGAVDEGFEVDAENNWWGDDTPGDNVNGSGTASIDYDPFETSAYPEN